MIRWIAISFVMQQRCFPRIGNFVFLHRECINMHRLSILLPTYDPLFSHYYDSQALNYNRRCSFFLWINLTGFRFSDGDGFADLLACGSRPVVLLFVGKLQYFHLVLVLSYGLICDPTTQCEQSAKKDY